MANFALALVNIMYALVCLTKESDQGKCPTSDSVEASSKKGAEGKRYPLTLSEQKKFRFQDTAKLI